ncbi:MAG: hypothetical protein ACI4VX_06335 [Succinivibrionaceae bacterium]
MVKNVMYSFLLLLLLSCLGFSRASATLQDGYTCILKMQMENQDHRAMSCQSALLQDKDFMVYLIGQAYVNTKRYSEARSFYSEFLGTGYDMGARLGIWTVDRFVLGNKTKTDVNFKMEPEMKGILRRAMERSDPMAYYVLKGYFSKNRERIRYMAEDNNVYAAVDYVFSGKEPFLEKTEFITMAYDSGLPVAKVLYSIYGVVSNKSSDANLKDYYNLSKEALAEGSSCGNLSLSFFYRSGIEVEKDFKEATKLLNSAKDLCWYAEKYSDLAWR